jgi:hypothetical protein
LKLKLAQLDGGFWAKRGYKFQNPSSKSQINSNDKYKKAMSLRPYFYQSELAGGKGRYKQRLLRFARNGRNGLMPSQVWIIRLLKIEMESIMRRII